MPDTGGDIAPWAFDYVGLPFQLHGRTRAGIDCWGLLRLVLAERFRVDVPSYNDPVDRDRRGDLITGEAAAHWTPIWRQQAADGDPAGQPGDGVILRMAGIPCHVAVLVGRHHMLHVQAGQDAVIERLLEPRWLRRVLSIWRHPARRLAAGAPEARSS